MMSIEGKDYQKKNCGNGGNLWELGQLNIKL